MKPHALSVVLTGGIDPIGAAIARALVRRGARVLLVARDAAPLVALAAELAPPDDKRYRVDALAADIASPHGSRAVLDAAIARRTNALINAPAMSAPSMPEQPPASSADTLAATLHITRTLLPHLLARPDARVLMIGPSFTPGLPVESVRAIQNTLREASEALRRETSGGSVRVQFLGRRIGLRSASNDEPAPTSPPRIDRPEYIASVAVQMLVAGTRERFVGIGDDVLGRVNAVLAALLDPAPKHRRA